MQALVRQVLNIRQEEAWYVRTLFLHHFFQGIGVALFYTMANAMFLSSFPITHLAWVYLAAGLSLLVIGRAYAYFEHHLSIERLLSAVPALLILSVILLRLSMGLTTASWVPFVLMIWYYAIYLLGSLEFWGLSALLFDVRQSKRLFGLISAGDIPAKLLGYLSVSVLVPVIGLSNLALVAGGSFLLSLAFLRRLLQQRRMHPQTGASHEAPSHQHASSRSALLRFFGHDFILSLGGIAFFSIVSLTLIDFAFLSEVKYRYKDEASLAAFLGFFFSFGKGLTIFLKVFFSGRLIDRLGMRRSLLILPVLLLLLILLLIPSYFLPVSHAKLLILFGLMTLVGDILQYALHDPVFLALFQPLHQHLRLHGHTIIKGFVNPVGMALAGLVLVLWVQLYQSVDLAYLSTLLLLPIGGWIGMVGWANRKYIHVLRHAVNQHYLRGSELLIGDKGTLATLEAKLDSPHPQEVIYATQLVEKSATQALQQWIPRLLHHANDEVVVYGLRRVEALCLHEAKPQVLALMHSERSSGVRAAALKAFCGIEKEDAFEEIQPYLQSNEVELRRGAITGLLNTGGIEATVFAGQELLRLIHAGQAEERALGAHIIGDLGIERFYQPLVGLLQDPEPQVRRAALTASRHVGNPRLLPCLIPFLESSRDPGLVMQALVAMRDKAVAWMRQQLQEASPSEERMLRFIQMARQIKDAEAVELLLRLTDAPSARVRTKSIAALKQLDPTLNADQERQVGLHFDREIAFAYDLYQLQRREHIEALSQPLTKALSDELWLAKTRLFELLCLFFENKLLKDARDGLLEAHGSSANAIEILDHLLSKSVVDRLVPIFEDLSDQERLAKIAQYRPAAAAAKPMDVPHYLLRQGMAYFERWTLALALREALQGPAERFTSLVAPYTESPYPILAETARRHRSLTAVPNSGAPLEERPSHREQPPYLVPENSHAMSTPPTDSGALSQIEKVLILKATPMFVETPENVLVDLAAIIEEVRVPAETTIVHKGEEGYCMYIIYDGEVRIHDEATSLALLSRNDFFGELSLLDPEPRSASATTLQDCLLLRLDQEPFYEVLNETPTVARGILKVLCQRLRRQNALLSQKSGEAS